MTGSVSALTERQSQEDRQRGREPRQRIDEDSGLRMWFVTVTDPSAPSRDASTRVEIIAAHQPGLPQPVAGMAMAVTEVEFEDLRVQPRIGGSGEVRWLTWAYRASGVVAAGSGAVESNPAPKSTRASGKSSDVAGGA